MSFLLPVLLIVVQKVSPEERAFNMQYETDMFRFRSILGSTVWSPRVSLREEDARFLREESRKLYDMGDGAGGMFLDIGMDRSALTLAYRLQASIILVRMGDDYNDLVRFRATDQGGPMTQILVDRLKVAAGDVLRLDRAAKNMTLREPNTGVRKKAVLLTGPAALYWMYCNQVDESTASRQGRSAYYLSKNGRMYYRDATAQAHWVTPPAEGIAVPAQAAKACQGLQGYGGSKTGETNLMRFAERHGGL